MLPPQLSIAPYTTITTLFTITASLLLIQSQPATSSISVTAPFRQKGVTGSITFTQSSPSSPTIIDISLAGLSPGHQYPWHVHQYPFASGTQSPCSSFSVGGHYDPFKVSQDPNYTSNCASNQSLCEVGDLSGRHSKLNVSLSSFSSLTDDYLSLYGQYSIVGRSIVIHFNDGKRYICANIGYPDNNDVYPVTLQVPFRGGPILGDIYLTQYSNNATVVHTNLINTNAPPPSLNHNWHVHEDPVTHGDTTCSSTMGHYNPRMVDISTNYVCNGGYPLSCEVGDLSGKGGTLGFTDSMSAQTLYTDTDLPIVVSSEGFSIANRSIVIHEGAGRIACGDMIGSQTRKAVASFTGHNGVSGTIRLRQASPVSPTEVEVDLVGLNGRAGSYNVYQTPIGGGAGGERCSAMYTGDPLLPEIGDLSGKFGSLSNANTFNGLFTDSNIPLYGPNSIIGRSIVINDSDNNTLTCADIVYDMPVVQVSAMFNISGHVVRFVFVQPAGEPYSDTTITVQTVTQDEGDKGASTSTSVQQQSTMTTPLTTTPTSTIVMATSSSNSSSTITMMSSSSSTMEALSTQSTTTLQSSSTTSLSPLQQSSSSSTMDVASSKQSATTLPSMATSSSSLQQSTVTGSSSAGTTSSMILSSSSSSSVMVASTSIEATTLLPSSSSNTTPLPTTTTFSSSNIAMVTSTSSAAVSSTTSSSSTELLSSLDVLPTPMPPMMRRKRDTEEEYIDVLMDSVEFEDDERDDVMFAAFESEPQVLSLRKVVKREVMSVKWSVRSNNNNGASSSNCSGFNDFLPSNSGSSSLCSMDIQLACSAGALSLKHGSIEIDSENGVRMVLTDQYLPLSGPDSAVGSLLLIEDSSGGQYVTIATTQDPPVVTTCSGGGYGVLPSSSTSTTTTTTTTSAAATPTQTGSGNVAGLPLSLPIFIIVCVGGTIALAVIVLLVIVVIVCCVRRRSRYEFEDYMKTKSNNLELGMYKKTNPLEGTDATYEVLYDYKPQQDGDLALKQGEIVTVLEAPVGGEWWRGQVDGGKDGWFPKSYVNYIDMKAEEKKKKAAQMDKAAQVIRAYTLADNRLSANRLSTLQIDSTPRAVTKFDKPLKEVTEEETTLSDTNNGDFPLPNTPPDSHTGTPSLNNRRVASNDAATVITLESPPSSNEFISGSNTVSSPPASDTTPPVPSTTPVSPVSPSDVYIAKFDLVPESDSELQLVAGEQVMVLEKNDNGWWHGVVGERQGWVPETFLELVHDGAGGDEGQESIEGDGETELRPRCMTEFHSGTSDEVNVNEYQAIADYQSNTEGDLSFKEGDQVLVYWGNEDGWWYGAAGTAQGYFPGSHVEPVMEESNPSEPPLSPISDTSIPSPNDVLQGEEQHGATATPSPTIVTEPQGTGESLADQIAAALKKKQQDTSSNDTTSTPPPIDVSSVQGEEDGVLKERSDSMEKLSTDIVAMISGMGDDSRSNAAQQTKPKSATLQAVRKAPSRTPSRRAPPPPRAAGRTKNKPSKEKASTLTTSAPAAANNVPVPPPPPPLPPVAEGSSTQDQSSKNETKPEKEESKVTQAGQVAQPLVVKEPLTPGSAGSSPSRRRKPPPPPVATAGPSQLAAVINSKSPTPSSPSPLLVTQSASKSPTTPSVTTPTVTTPPVITSSVTVSSETTEQVDDSAVTVNPPSPPPISTDNSKATPEKVTEQRTSSAASSSKWQPQLKNKRGGGWKPQSASAAGKKEQQQKEQQKEPMVSSNRKKSSTSPKIKVQKVKRPQRNIPPPPSAPLPPPPPSSRRSSATTAIMGPPPVKKVLGPPPVKKVLGGSQMVKKPAVKSPTTSPPPPPLAMATTEKTDKRATPVKVPPPPLTLVSDQPETTPTTSPDQPKTDSTPNKPEISPKPKVKPAISPKPKIRPAVSPKPHKLVLQPNPEPDTKSIPTPSPSAKTPEVILRKNVLRPVPPKRVSSLPNTPEGSPAPSPTPQPRSQHIQGAESTDHHDNATDGNGNSQKSRKVSIPSRPPPPKTTVTQKGSETSSPPTTDVSGPVAPARKKSSGSVPPPQRPSAPPKIGADSQDKKKNEEKDGSSVGNDQPTTPSRKVSDVGVRVKNLMSPMKTLEGRPSRNGRRSLSTPSEEDDETTETKPTPKRRTSHNDPITTATDTTVTKTTVPARPPPPAITTPTAVKPLPPTDSDNSVQPIPKPRAKS